MLPSFVKTNMLLPIRCAILVRREQSACMQTTEEEARPRSAGVEFLRDLLTVEEVAQQLKLTPKTVRKMCLSRRLTAIRIQRSWRIPVSALNEFLRDRLLPRV